MKYIDGAIKQILEASYDVSGLLNENGGVYMNHVPDNARFPSIMIQQISVQKTNVKGSTPKGPDIYLFSISAWAEDLEDAKDIMAEVREELNGLSDKIAGFQMRIWKSNKEGLREDQVGPKGVAGEAHDYFVRHQY